MNTIELVAKGSAETLLYACGKCGAVKSPSIFAGTDETTHDFAKRLATECCDKRCARCGGQPVEQYYTVCSTCREVLDQERRAARFDRAEKIPEGDHNDAVYDEATERYFQSTDELRSYYADNQHGPVPAFAYACTTRAFTVNANDVIEHALEQMEWDEAEEGGLYEVQELRAFLAAWNAKQSYSSWHADFTRIVVLNADPG